MQENQSGVAPVHQNGQQRPTVPVRPEPEPDCGLCPRLSAYRSSVRPKSPIFRDYWNKPVPSCGDENPWLLVVGLAPGAHGANRTGLPFQGDSAGVLLYAALFDAGLSAVRDVLDGPVDPGLAGVRITNAVRCVPPGNRPTPVEFRACRGFLSGELSWPSVTDVLCIGSDAWREVFRALSERAPAFAHGSHTAAGRLRVTASLHTSRYNQNTKRINAGMLASVLRSVRSRAGR